MTVVLQPTTAPEAARFLAENVGAVVMAGCTDLMVVDFAERRVHPFVIDLLSIPELSGIAESSDGGIRIGATTSFQTIGSSPLVQSRYPILARAAASIGGWQIQNRATLGGNIANASPAGDSLPVLLALNADLTLVGPGGERHISYDEMHLSYRQTALGDSEIIGWVHLPPPPKLQQYRKVGTRAAQAISKVVVALAGDHTDGSLRNVRVAAGSVAAIPTRLTQVEALLDGSKLDPALADRVGLVAGDEVSPIDDVRSTAEYRSHVLGRIIRRMVLDLC